jgi:hypothetical protein
MMITEIISMLEKEIEWHKIDNKNYFGLSEDYKDGFVRGLIQAKNLIEKTVK